MTTSSDRVLLRWLPLAVFLAAVMTVGLTLVSHPFGYQTWPTPPAAEPVERLVEVEPTPIQTAPAVQPPRPLADTPRAEPSPDRISPRQATESAPQGRSGRSEDGDNSGFSRGGDSSGPGSGDSPREGDSSSGSSPGESSGPGGPLAQRSDVLPADGHAKPDPGALRGVLGGLKLHKPACDD